MKKLTALLLLLCLVFGLASCVSDGGESSSAAESSKAADSSETVESSEVVESSDDEDSSELVESSEVEESSEPEESSNNEQKEKIIYNTTVNESYGVNLRLEGNYQFAEEF